MNVIRSPLWGLLTAARRNKGAAAADVQGEQEQRLRPPPSKRLEGGEAFVKACQNLARWRYRLIELKFNYPTDLTRPRRDITRRDLT